MIFVFNYPIYLCTENNYYSFIKSNELDPDMIFVTIKCYHNVNLQQTFGSFIEIEMGSFIFYVFDKKLLIYDRNFAEN